MVSRRNSEEEEAKINIEQSHRRVPPIPMAYRRVTSASQHLIVLHAATGVSVGDFIEFYPGRRRLFRDWPGL
jgi:hypothetical protein